MTILINGKPQDIQANGSVDFTANQSMGGFRLTDLNTPINPNDAVNKTYIDQLAALNNAKQIYVDSVSGDDTNGNGSVLKPIQTLTKALTLCVTSDNYVFILSPGDYTESTLTWKDNVSVFGYGGTANINTDINYTAGAVGSTSVVFNGVNVNGELTVDLSAATIAFVTISQGNYKITRTDTAAGPHVLQALNCTLGDVDITGTFLVSNCLFVSTCNVQSGGTISLIGCTFGISADVYGTGILYFSSSLFVGSITGHTIGLDTPIVNIDSSSNLGTIIGCTIQYTDNADYIDYNPAVSANWSTVPNTVAEAIDMLAEASSSPMQQEIYVSKNGNDSTATGSIDRTFLTVQAAISYITDNADNKKYTIYISPGTYTESTLTIKPNINIVSFGTHDAVSSAVFLDIGTISLDSSWVSATANSSVVFQGIRFIDDSTFNGNVVSAGGGIIEFNQCQFNNQLVLVGYQENLSFSALYSVTNSGLDFSGSGYLSGQIVVAGGTFTVTSEPGYLTQLVLTNGFCSVPATITCNTGDTIIAYLKDNVFLSTLSLDGSGLTVNTTSSSLPPLSSLTLLNSPTINLLNHANVIGYEPTTPGDWSSVPNNVHDALDELAASGGGGSITFKKNKTSNATISGVIDGINTSFTLTNTPLTDSLFLFLNGMILVEGDHYSLSGNTITLNDAPQTGDNLLAQYTI